MKLKKETIKKVLVSTMLITAFLFSVPSFAQDNVGIGTTSPNSKLEIRGTNSAATASSLNVTDSVGSTLLFVRNDGNIGVGTTSPGARFMVVGADDMATTPALNITNKSLKSLMHIKNDGKVGIGTTSPGAKFMVVGLGTTNATAAINITNSMSNSLFHIKDDGNIGVGTTSPGAKIEVVNGDVYLTNSANGIILTAPNNSCYRVTVDMTGKLVSTSVTCP